MVGLWEADGDDEIRKVGLAVVFSSKIKLDGDELGDDDERSDGLLEGDFDGFKDGTFVGGLLSNVVGAEVGWIIGCEVGWIVGAKVGRFVGGEVESLVGALVWKTVGLAVSVWRRDVISTISTPEDTSSLLTLI